MCFQVPEVEAAQDEAAGAGGGAGSGAHPSREEKERLPPGDPGGGDEDRAGSGWGFLLELPFWGGVATFASAQASQKITQAGVFRNRCREGLSGMSEINFFTETSKNGTYADPAGNGRSKKRHL